MNKLQLNAMVAPSLTSPRSTAMAIPPTHVHNRNVYVAEGNGWLYVGVYDRQRGLFLEPHHEHRRIEIEAEIEKHGSLLNPWGVCPVNPNAT